MPERIDILLVEDNPGDRELILDALSDNEQVGYIHAAADGVAAAEYLHREGRYADAAGPDLILMDLKLPRKDGLELLEEIRGDPELGHIPVIVLTSSDTDRDVERAYELNANAYIVKPVDLDGLDTVMGAIERFWLTVVRYSPKNGEHHEDDQPNLYRSS